MLYFSIQNARPEREEISNLCCAAGCGLTGSWSERSRIILGSAAHWK